MKVTYDPETDSLYIELGRGSAVDAREIEDGVVLDLDANGHAVGIDFQHASEWIDVSRVVVSGVPVR